MSVTVPAEIAGAKIVEWYSCIVAREIEQAKQLRVEAKSILEASSSNEKMNAYYQLVELRHELMLENFNVTAHTDSKAATLAEIHSSETLDNTLRYFYYFVSGQYEFYSGRYRSAVKMFRKAEFLLGYSNDDAERGEFYHQLGMSFYRIDQHLMAASYIEQAQVLFERLGYTERAINTTLAAGLIDMEVHRYQQAEGKFKEALAMSNPYPHTKSLILRAMGLNHVRLNNLDKAQGYFEQALAIPEHHQGFIGNKSKYSLAHILFKRGHKNQAMPLLKEATLAADLFRNTEYKARCLALRGLYVAFDLAYIDKALELLEKNDFYFEMEQISKETSDTLRIQGDTDHALKYMQIAYSASNQKLLGDDQFD